MIVYNYTGYVNRELKEIIFGGIFQGEFFKADASGRDLLCWQRGQGNFELAANSGYDSRGSADPRESLRKRRISKLPLSAHKVLPGSETVSRLLCVGKWKIYTITTATFSTPQSQSKKGALMESWQIVEHEFETTGSNRAQTLPAFHEGAFLRRTFASVP